MSDAPECQSRQVRWAVIVTLGRVVVEAETADAASEKVERKGYIVLEVKRLTPAIQRSEAPRSKTNALFSGHHPH